MDSSRMRFLGLSIWWKNIRDYRQQSKKYKKVLKTKSVFLFFPIFFLILRWLRILRHLHLFILLFILARPYRLDLLHMFGRPTAGKQHPHEHQQRPPQKHPRHNPLLIDIPIEPHVINFHPKHRIDFRPRRIIRETVRGELRNSTTGQQYQHHIDEEGVHPGSIGFHWVEFEQKRDAEAEF